LLKHNSFHIYIAKRILDECNDYSYTLKRDRVRRRLWLCHIPLDLHNKFLEEMEDLGLIKKLNQKYFMVMKDNIDRFYLQ